MIYSDDPGKDSPSKSPPAGKAVVLLSGGLDSSTVLAMAKAGGREVYAMSFDYHQRHRIELEAAEAVSTALGVKRHMVVAFDLRSIGGSALTADIDVPKEGEEAPASTSPEEGRSPVIPVTYVPARNTIFLSFALSWAEVLQAEEIFIGANAVDFSGYPDCRPEYLSAFEAMANLATKVSVEGGLKFKIRAPLIAMKKSEIILAGTNLGLDYSLTWSCYDPRELPGGGGGVRRTGFVPCGACDSCRLRRKGFAEAGLVDPLLSLHV